MTVITLTAADPLEALANIALVAASADRWSGTYDHATSAGQALTILASAHAIDLSISRGVAAVSTHPWFADAVRSDRPILVAALAQAPPARASHLLAVLNGILAKSVSTPLPTPQPKKNVIAMTPPDRWAAAYRAHAASLRAWFLAFGVGAPLLLYGTEEVWWCIAATDDLQYPALAFASGIATQVLGAFLDKYGDWFGLTASQVGEASLARPYRAFLNFWMTHDWPSWLLDLATMVGFGWATLQLWDILREATILC